MATLFTKTLTKIDIESHLSIIPACSLGPLPFEEGHSMNMHVHDDNGQEWVFPCSVQRNDNVGLVFTLDWAEFVRQKGVRIDDMVIFHEEVIWKSSDAKSTWIRVEVKRKIRLFGEDIWADLK